LLNLDFFYILNPNSNGNKIIGGSKGRKTLLGFVPYLKLLVKALDEVIGDIVFDTFNPNMFDVMLNLVKNGNSLSGISVR